MPHIQSGRIKILAVTTAQRVPQLPDVPTIAEAGYADYAGVGWSGSCFRRERRAKSWKG